MFLQCDPSNTYNYLMEVGGIEDAKNMIDSEFLDLS